MLYENCEQKYYEIFLKKLSMKIVVVDKNMTDENFEIKNIVNKFEIFLFINGLILYSS